VPPAKKPLQVTLPTGIAAEIADAARRTQRSTAFIVRRALAAAPKNPDALPTGATTSLALTLDEDDPPNTLAKIKSAAAPQSLDGAIAAAWLATRARFHAFIAREESAASAERADDLDAGLRDARDPKTPLSRLTELAASDYPKIRALVAQHPATPPALLARLSQDREPYVREAAARSR
jgi:hypothetical protein